MKVLENVPIYVKVDKYQELLETVKAIETKLNTVNKTIEKINELKGQEDAQMKNWTENLSDLRSRLDKINNAFHNG